MSAYDRNNVFAQILRGEAPCTKVYEDEFALAFDNIHPSAPVHVLVIPKGEYVSHADFAATAPAELIVGFWRAVARTATKLGLDEPGYRLVANHGLDAHQVVFHFHVHVMGGRRMRGVSAERPEPLGGAAAEPLPQVVDLAAEADEFTWLLNSLKDEDWERPTQFKGWTPNDIVRHLHAGDLLALASATSANTFFALAARGDRMRSAGASRREIERDRIGGDFGGAGLRQRWRSTLDRLCNLLAEKPVTERLAWAGPDMGVRMFTTARQMEVWSHAQAIYDAMGVERPAPSPRLRNVAEIGVRTFGWTYKVRSLPIPPMVPPAFAPHVRLGAPGGKVWEWNASNPTDRVSGDAVEFCQVVTQTRNIADTRLAVEGEVARQWMSIAQCFAGPPETPPAKGTRYRQDRGS